MSEKEIIREYRVGGKDSRQRLIQAIFAHFDSYILYQAEGRLEIQGELAPLDNSAEVQKRLDILIPLTPDDEKGRNRFHRSLSAAIVACMNRDDESATILLDQLIQRMSLKVLEVGRLLYLAGAVIVAAISCLASIALHLSNLPPRSTLVLLAYMAAFGGLGGVFSVATKLPRIQVDRDSGVWFNLVSGASRALIAIIGGIFAYLAMKTGLLLTILADSSDVIGLLLGGFLAGFSETIVPNTLRRAESDGA